MTDPNTLMSDAEREVLKALWELDRATVRQIRDYLQEQGRAWAHTTINTLLARLEEKRLIKRDASGFAHVFAAAVSRDALVHERLNDLADQYCDGEAAPLMLAFVEGQQFSEAEIAEFRQLLDRLEQENTRPRRKRSSRKRKKP